MILFRDWELRSSGPLGRQYDHLSRRLDVEGELPEGWEWAMLVQINGAMDIIPLEETETGVGAVLTREQLSFSGNYQMQLRGTKGDVVRHTNTISALVPKSISGDGQWPKIPSEFTQIEQSILASAQQVREDANRAETAAEEAERQVQSVDLEKIDERIAGKADNLEFDTEEGALYLTSDGVRIGDGVKVNADAGVSSWNDLTDRPFYEEISMVEVLPEKAITIASWSTGPNDVTSGSIAISAQGPFVAGKEYIVDWDGTKYDVLSREVSGGVYMGNRVLWTSLDINTGEPFGLYYHAESGMTVVYVIQSEDNTSTAEETHTVSVNECDRSIKKLSAKFLPDECVTEEELDSKGYAGQDELDGKQDTLTGTAGQVVGFDADGNAVAKDNSWNDLTDKPFGEDENGIHHIEGQYLPKGTPWIEEDVAGAEILPKTTVMLNEDGNGEADVFVPLISGEKYIVTWNGTKYVCEAMEGTTSGDSDTLGMMTDEFVFVAFIHEKFVLSSYDSTLTEVTISINKCVTNIGKIDGRCLSDGTPYVQENTLLGETEATSTTHPTFGQMWRVMYNTPKLIVGKTYGVTYNDTAYKCVCQTAPAGLTSDPDAVAMGNFAPVGGPNTGEPFAMLVSHAYQEVDIIDLVGSSAVKVKISEITAASETYLSSPNGTIFKITVSDDGTLTATAT